VVACSEISGDKQAQALAGDVTTSSSGMLVFTPRATPISSKVINWARPWVPGGTHWPRLSSPWRVTCSPLMWTPPATRPFRAALLRVTV